MKKNLNLSISSLFVIALSVYFSKLLDLKYMGIGFGIITLITSIILFSLDKKSTNRYYICFFVNSIATGLFISSYYSVRNISLEISYLIFSVLFVSILLIISFKIIKYIKFNNKSLFKFLLIDNIILLIILSLFWIRYENNTLFSMTSFLVIASIFYLFMFNNFKTEEKIPKDLALYSYGIFILIAILVFGILSEGEIDFLGDIPVDFKKKKKY